MNDKIRKGYLTEQKPSIKTLSSISVSSVIGMTQPKPSELAASMIKNNVDVILTICGGGNAGVRQPPGNTAHT